ncbi:uncharacterized protein LOC133831386 [Humulus lupulus]|uniref:uncharacterized protein LOC133831386 n=1 Tax=Humulus lupulus TaxID=3486 RepID=UPI002B409C69|nr:uncharacterized protein LOC133831386 [Humulus lupulus]
MLEMKGFEIRLIGTEFPDSKIAQKLLVTVPERYEASVTTLENMKDMSKITLAEILHAFQAQEQRRFMREDYEIEGALPAKHQDAEEKNEKNLALTSDNTTSNQFQKKVEIQRKTTHLVNTVVRKVIHLSDAGGDQMQSAANVINLDMKP